MNSHYHIDNPTLYTSGYLVANPKGYTKHYYAGSERISSAIGLGGLGNINNPLPIEFGGSWDEKSGSLMEEMNRTIVECLKNEYKIEASLKFLHDMKEAVAGTMDRYFYHPDHLGSSSVSTPLNNHWITDGSGNAIQHLHYLPFGEDWVDQRNASWSAPYTFSGKEKDVETGYSYFGARYYDSGLSIWLSVDPMSDKYPNLTPYGYCANNPVILVDPDGRWVIGAGFFRNLFRSDAYCKAYLVAKSHGLPESSIIKYGKGHYGINYTSYDVVTIHAFTPSKSKISFKRGSQHGRGGINLYNTNKYDRPGPDRTTDADVEMVDITHFPTGVGGIGDKSPLDAMEYIFGGIQRISDLYDASQKLIEQQKKDAYEKYMNDTIHVPDCEYTPPHWKIDKDWVPRKDSLKRANEKKEECKRKHCKCNNY